MSVGSTVTGALEVVGDHDWFKIELTAGQAVTITLSGVTLRDPYLRIRDSAGNIIYENDDISPECADSGAEQLARRVARHLIPLAASKSAAAGLGITNADFRIAG